MPRSAASCTTAFKSFGDITAPEGFEGEFKNNHFGARSYQARDHFRSDAKALTFVGFEQHTVSAGVADDVLERNPVGHGQNYFVTVIHQHLDGIEQGMLAPDRGHAFLAAVVGPEVSRVAAHDGVTQFRRSAYRGVLREIILDRADRGIFDVLRRGKVWFARSEIHDVNPLLAQFVGLGYHCHGG